MSVSDLFLSEHHLSGCVKRLVRKRVFGPGLVRAILPFNENIGAQPELCVFVRDDFRAAISEGFVRTGIVRMPIGVENRGNVLRRDLAGNELQQLARAVRTAAIDQQNTFRPGNGKDVRPGSGDLNKVLSEWCSGNSGRGLLREQS